MWVTCNHQQNAVFGFCVISGPGPISFPHDWTELNWLTRLTRLTKVESKNWEKGTMQYMFATMKSNPEHGVLTGGCLERFAPCKVHGELLHEWACDDHKKAARKYGPTIRCSSVSY